VESFAVVGHRFSVIGRNSVGDHETVGRALADSRSPKTEDCEHSELLHSHTVMRIVACS